MEPFVQTIVSSGLALIAGLWLTTLFGGLWAGFGWGLVLVGIGGLGWGIGQKIEW